MKKKLTITLLLAVCAFSLVLFTACGDKPTEVIPTGHTHEYAETVTKAATCTTDGEKTFTCACGDGYTSPIPALGHDFSGDGTKVVAPTCTEDGYTNHTCKREGCGFTEKVDVVKATGHDYKVTTVNPTCTEDGHIDQKCANCGDEKTTGIAKTGHNVAYEIDEEATCTTAGRKHGACQNEGCDYTTENEVIPALGHDLDLGAGVEKKTGVGTIYIDYECNRCGEHVDGDIITDPEDTDVPSGSAEDE